MPSTMPRPARRMGTTATFFPSMAQQEAVATGVSTETSRKGKSRVAS